MREIESQKQEVARGVFKASVWAILTFLQVVTMLFNSVAAFACYHALKEFPEVSCTRFEKLVIVLIASIITYLFSRPLKKLIQYFSDHEIEQIKTYEDDENFY